MVAEFTILGRLTKDPDTNYTAAGQTVTKLSIAVNNSYKGKDETSFFTVTVFGRSAENASQYLSKGKQVFISGEMKQNTWTGNDGAKNTKYEFLARKVVFIGAGNSPVAGRTAAATKDDDFVPEIDDNDIPF